ncbi:MAG: helix-turn-helix transcriptional regulator [Spirochaetes bacterium]|nr:helix-turn-helix transcriptional regulator [Spirochaetota bacterium]
MREIFATICIAGALQALLLSLVLIIKRNNRRANRFLSLFTIFMALDALELYLASRGNIVSARPYQFSILPYSYIFGPSIFLYVALLTARINAVSKKHLLLYAPFLLALGVNIFLFAAFETPRLPQSVLHANMVINGGGLIFEAFFYVLSFYIIHNYIERLKEYFSAIDRMKLSLFRMGLLVLILVVIAFFVSLAWDGHVRRDYKLPDVIAILISMGLGFVIAFIAMIQPEIFNRVRLMEKAVPDEGGGAAPRYEKLRLPASDEEGYVKKLKRVMDEKNPHLREDLTLQDLADELSISTHHLSMVLNIHFKQNFYTFVNGYRVDEAKRKLADPDYRDHTILSIAFGSGFNSKTTFNHMFKKFTGKTPREYRVELSL